MATQAEIIKLLTKKYGKIVFSGKDIKDNPRQLIPTTPALDLSIKGIPEGTWVQISGKPKTGKTSLALQIAANAQKQDRHIVYIDVEHRFAEKSLNTVSHLNTDPEFFTLIQSSEEKILDANDFLEIAVSYIENLKRCIIIIDSYSALCSTKERSNEMGTATRSEGPKMLAQFTRVNASKVPINKVVVIGISHLIANTSGYGSPYNEDGGNKVQYQDDCKLRIKGIQDWTEGSGEAKKQIGQIVTWDVTWNPTGPPGDTVETYLRYGYGYDGPFELVNIGINLGIIEKGGAWFTYDGTKYQGQKNLRDFFVENPNKQIELQNKIKEML